MAKKDFISIRSSVSLYLEFQTRDTAIEIMTKGETMRVSNVNVDFNLSIKCLLKICCQRVIRNILSFIFQ